MFRSGHVRSKFIMRLVITFHTLLLFATILALQPKILLILEGTEETNFVFARESPCFIEYHHLIVCILKRMQNIGKIQHDHYETFLEPLFPPNLQFCHRCRIGILSRFLVQGSNGCHLHLWAIRWLGRQGMFRSGHVRFFRFAASFLICILLNGGIRWSKEIL
jgi:hypothetical protein